MDEPGFDELPVMLPVLAPRPARAALPRLAGILAGGVLLGFVLGLAAAPQGKAPATLPPVAVAPAVVAVSSPAPSIVPQAATSTIVGPPPADALALPVALAMVGRAGFGVSSTDVISARLTTVASAEAASSSLVAPPDEWVWAFIVRGSFPPASCGGITVTPHACPSPATTMLILLDARTGEFVLARSPAQP